MRILYLFIVILSVNSVNFHYNELTPIDFHIDKDPPQGIDKKNTITCNDVYETYSTNDPEHKIGNVMFNDKIVYGDSDILDYRRVMTKTNRNGNKLLIIYSIYSNSGDERREVTEFKMTIGSEEYIEMVRTPVELDLKEKVNQIYRPIVEIRYPNKTYFRVSKNLRDTWVIGLIKFGDLVIDDSIYTVTYKEAIITLEQGEEYISIMKRTKDGHSIRTKYRIVEENGTVQLNQLEESIQRLSHNIESNNRISVRINIPTVMPNCVKYRFAHNTQCGIYEIGPEDREYFKIGAVYEYGILVYEDSDILVERKVYKLARLSIPASIIQINSKYKKSGKIIGEIIELIRLPHEDKFKEIVRRPFEINIKKGYINSPAVRVTRDRNREKVRYEIRNEDRLKYMIGEVKYGNIKIESYVNTVTYKTVTTYEDAHRNIIVEVHKVMKTAEFISTRCMMIFDEPPETGFCQELEVKVTNLYP
nr:hypothetical protein MACL_00002014 [Theileria orientalis]